MQTQLDEFATLLQNVVHAGASIGFLPPLTHADAADYWSGVAGFLPDGDRVLLAAYADDELVGTVQLDLERRPNGNHRGEVMKLMVHTDWRRQGVAQALMAAVERRAEREARTLLVLDTRQGDAAEQLYRRLGYSEAGVIPAYARSADGGLDATIIMYKLLEPVGRRQRQ